MSGIKSFPKEVIEQTNVAVKTRIAPYLAKRRDLRSKMLFSFSNLSNTPSETAFSLYPYGDGWQLGVHITDVAEYVCEGSPLDIEACKRVGKVNDGFSVNEMLPDKIVNEVCNLADDKDKLALSVLINLDKNGNFKSLEFEESVIRVSINCIFGEIDQLGSTRDNSAVMALRKKYALIMDTLLDLYELAAVFCMNRRKRGGLDCTYFKREYKKDQDNKIISFNRVAEEDSRAMVREIGYFTAEAVGRFMCEHNIPSIFNGRGNIDQEILEYLCQLVGMEKDSNKTLAEITADIADLAKGRDYYGFVCDVLKSAVPSAVYSSTPIYNSLCGCDHIVSFFNPATHYTDLLIQRVLKIVAKAEYSLHNINMNKFHKKIHEVVDLSNRATDYLEKTLSEYSTVCALGYLEDTKAEQESGIVVRVNDDGSIIAALTCGAEALISSEDAKDYNAFGGKRDTFEIISVSKEEKRVLVKPIA